MQRVQKPSNDQVQTDSGALAVMHFRNLAAKQRLMAQQERLPRVRDQLLQSADKWEFLADSTASLVRQVIPLPEEHRLTSPAGSVALAGKLKIDLRSKTIEMDGTPVRLAGREYAIMERLALSKGELVTKEDIYRHLYSGLPCARTVGRPEPKIVDVLVCNLRKKLSKASGGENFIHTTWGRGYMLVEQGDHARAA